MNAFVKVIKGGEPWQTAYKAVSAVFTDKIKGKRVLLKPSVGFEGPAKSGLSTHPEVIRGLIRFFKDKKAGKIIVGDSSVIGVNSVNALRSAGITDVCDEEGVSCIDLNSSPPVEMKIKNGCVVDSILFSSIVFEMDYVISVPVMKTHMYTGASLSIKNMKGSMYKREKNKLHRIEKPVPKGATARALDYGIMDLTTVCLPDYTLADGTVGMEGFGPSGGTPKKLGCIVASQSPLAADMVAMQLMGLTLDEVGHIRLIAEREKFTYGNIIVDPPHYKDYISPFITPASAKRALKCDTLEFIDESACSGCHAALTQFMRYHLNEFTDSAKNYLFAGKDINAEEIIKRGNKAFLVGNCTYKFRDLAPICKGCPPVDSEILKMVKGLSGISVSYLGHSAFNLSTKDYTILIDPLREDNFLASARHKNVKATHICVTQGHSKHMEMILEMAKPAGAEVYTMSIPAGQSASDVMTVVGNIGDKVKTEFGWIEFVRSGRFSGIPAGEDCGYLIAVEGIRIYHAGRIFPLDVQGFDQKNIDVVLLSLDSNSVVDTEEAFQAVKLSRPKHVIPVYDYTTLTIDRSLQCFKAMIEDTTRTKVHLLNPGETTVFQESGKNTLKTN